MTRSEIREEIFKILFERELVDNGIAKRTDEIINEENIRNPKHIEFLKSYVTGVEDNKDFLVEKIKATLKGWTYERLGTIEKALLKLSFYEILIEKMEYEIVINETMEIAKKYSYDDTREFLNGILAQLVNDMK